MKSILYSTTALVAVGVLTASPTRAQEGIELGIGGYMNNFTSFGHIDESDVETRDFNSGGHFSDGEIEFFGEVTLDNGLSFGADVQLEAFQSDPDQIDENYGYVEGPFGRLQFGSADSAAYLMQYAAPFVGVPLNSGWITSFVPPPPTQTTGFVTPALSTFLDYGEDENQITYFSPRLSGFQVGVSYAPAVVATGEGKNFPVQADKETEFYDGVSVGVNFVETIGSFDVAVAGGYRRASAPDTPGAAGNLPGNDDNLNQYSAGVNVGFAGFTVGGSYALEDSGRPTDGDAFDVGASYSLDVWSFGLTWFHSEIDGITGSDDELNAYSGAIGHNLGPGIDTSLTVLYAEWEPGTGSSQEGIQGVLGIQFSF